MSIFVSNKSTCSISTSGDCALCSFLLTYHCNFCALFMFSGFRGVTLFIPVCFFFSFLFSSSHTGVKVPFLFKVPYFCYFFLHFSWILDAEKNACYKRFFQLDLLHLCCFVFLCTKHTFICFGCIRVTCRW